MRHHPGRRTGEARAVGWHAEGRLALTGVCHRPASALPPGCRSANWWQVLAVAVGALLGAGACWPAGAADPEPPIPPEVQRPLEIEDWPGVLASLEGDPLTNAVLRLAVVRALFETGRLPDEQFAWLHTPAAELLATTGLRQHVGSAYLADTVLELGHLNAAERLAFDSLEMEGEGPAVLRTLVRIHAAKGLPVAAGIFLNRLDAYPEHRAWAGQFRSRLASDSTGAADPLIMRVQANLVRQQEVDRGLTTERLLRQALESNPENRMAFQFLMAHQLLERRLLQALRMLATSPQARAGPLPRHYAEAVLLHGRVYPGISVAALLPRVPAAEKTRFQAFIEMMTRATVASE